jgi:hypothetical protein
MPDVKRKKSHFLGSYAICGLESGVQYIGSRQT